MIGKNIQEAPNQYQRELQNSGNLLFFLALSKRDVPVMTTWQEIIQHYHIRHHTQLAKIETPLRDNFHITCIDYIKISNEGEFSYLSTRPECAEYYAAEGLFSTDPYLKHPSSHRSGLYAMESLGSAEFKENNLKVSNRFNLFLPLVLSKKTSDFVEFFCFAGENPGALQTLYFHHTSLLKLFAAHFKEELSPLLQEMDEASFSLIDLQGDAFYERVEQLCAFEEDALHAALISLGKKKEVQMAASLSPRERDCLKLLIHGNSAKDSALELNLSPRTVESYLENIKNKLLCANKRELFSIAADFADLGLL